MKKALIEGTRVSQVEPVNPDPKSGGIPFPVASPLKWVDCADDATPLTHYAPNGSDVVAIPAAPPAPVADAAAMDAAFQSGMTLTPPPSFSFDLQRAFIAKCISDEAYRLGKAPGALTGAELAALRTRIANIYKAL